MIARGQLPGCPFALLKFCRKAVAFCTRSLRSYPTFAILPHLRFYPAFALQMHRTLCGMTTGLYYRLLQRISFAFRPQYPLCLHPTLTSNNNPGKIILKNIEKVLDVGNTHMLSYRWARVIPNPKWKTGNSKSIGRIQTAPRVTSRSDTTTKRAREIAARGNTSKQSK